MFSQAVSESIGVAPRVAMSVDQGGASMVSMIGMAALAIDAGMCSIAVVVMGDIPRSGKRPYDREWGDSSRFGWSGIAAGYAMVARRHMELWGTTSAQLGAIAAVTRKYGASNPGAQLRKLLTVEEHQAEGFIVDPLRRSDCCLISDAGAAVIVTARATAVQLGARKPVPVLGFGQAHTSWSIEQRPELTDTLAAKSAAAAFEMAGVAPADISLAQIYDCFSITSLMTLESYGFCERGSGGPFAASGALDLDGTLPMNTSGGLLSESGMPGGQLVVEGVRQMRGESWSQVENPSTVIVSGQGGVMHTHSTLILEASCS
ncbi:hypothetical protein AU252_00875 [Pseudarthrobacter sulfonivorans]|uniref:Thiolase C-terminal domain-containing protein n=2 Tax=Pseudarthrobacter sulfonivorans TaxID=121292 RepID=A0A0U3QHX0_9MICC|nr:hypothetical protein AU252_00875 [Pseudarthrobacter sulfonivorans]